MEQHNCALVKDGVPTNCTGTQFWKYVPTLPTTNDFALEDLKLSGENQATVCECRATVNSIQNHDHRKLVGKWSDSSGSTQTFVPVGLWPRPQAVNVRLAYVLE